MDLGVAAFVLASAEALGGGTSSSLE